MEVFHSFNAEDKDVIELKSALTKDHDTVITIGAAGSWQGVLEYIIHCCRSAGKLRRKLVTPLADQDILCRLLLQESNRKLTEDSSFTRSELYELKSTLLRLRRNGEYECGEDPSTVSSAAKLYKEFLNKCNLVDLWHVCSEYTSLNLARGAIILLNTPSNSDLLVLEALGVEASTQISLEASKTIQGKECVLSELSKEDVGDNDEISIDFGTNCPGVEAWISFVRLLVNSRDDLSLARLVTVSGLLTHAQCQVVRKETNKTSLTMLQNLVSYTTQSALGGKSYAPGEEHPFFEFESSLVDLVKMVETAHTKIESIKDPETAVEKVTTQLKNWLQKRGVKTTCDLLEVWSSVASLLKARQSESCGTPGRGLIGKPVMNMLTGLVDLYSCISPVTDDSSEEVVEAKTPARSKKLAQFFRTPASAATLKRTSSSSQNDTAQDEDVDEFDQLVDLDGVRQKLKKRHSNLDEFDKPEIESSTTPVRPQYTRYKSCIAWAEDSSPVPDSADRENVRVYGSTLVSAGGTGSPGTPLSAAAISSVNDILKEITDKQEKERKEESEQLLKKVSAPAEKKSRKRLLVKEAEQDMMQKYGVENKKPEEEKNKKVKLTKEKSEKIKKKLATPKGQRKMTSFFTKS